MEFKSQRQSKAVKIIVLKYGAHIIEWLGTWVCQHFRDEYQRHGYISEIYNIIISSTLIVPLGVDFARVY